MFPRLTRAIALGCSGLSLGVLLYYLSRVPTAHIHTSDVLMIGLVTGVLGTVVLANLNTAIKAVHLTSAGIAVRTLFGTRALRWQEVEDLLDLPHSLGLRGAEGRPSIGFAKGSYGFALQHFEDLRATILRNVQARLHQEWGHLPLASEPTYRLPSLSALQWGGYGGTAALLVYGFILLPLEVGFFGWECVASASLGGLLLSPFLIRDLCKTRRRLVIRPAGVFQLDGKPQHISWPDLASIHVRAISAWVGSVELTGGSGVRIVVPLHMSRSGEFLFLVETQSDVTPSVG